MSPLLQCLDNSIKFLIIHRILPFSIIQLLAKEINRFTFLTQYNSYCTTTCITFNLKCLIEIRQSQYRQLSNLLFQSLKTLISSMCPLEFIFISPHCLNHSITNRTEIFYKFSVKIAKPLNDLTSPTFSG